MADKPETVFIVDDDSAVRDSLGLLLKSVKISSQSFASGDEFLEAYDPDWKGCVLLDIRMPRISGMEVQKQLMEKNSTLPIIFITASKDPEFLQRAKDIGAAGYFEKPYDADELLGAIVEILAE